MQENLPQAHDSFAGFIEALKGAGVAGWLIGLVAALFVLARPLTRFVSAIVTWVRGRPSLANVVTSQLQELGRQQGAFMTRMERRLERAEHDADEARAAAAECTRKHHECLEKNTTLERRIEQLERASET